MISFIKEKKLLLRHIHYFKIIIVLQTRLSNFSIGFQVTIKTKQRQQLYDSNLKRLKNRFPIFYFLYIADLKSGSHELSRELR